MKASLDNKTVRPGLMNYSFYSSDRHPASYAVTAPVVKAKRKRKYGFGKLAVVLLLLIVGLLGYHMVKTKADSSQKANAVVTAKPASTPAKPTTSQTAGNNQPAAQAAAPAPVNHCAGNTLSTFILVSKSQRHLWACQNSQQIYDTPVVTGISYLPADVTPAGTYHIYAKYTNYTLRGSDSTGSWNDFVYYWQPFLHNQYGNYGLHDATWRNPNAFGNIDQDSADASHGCVELPLAASKWLYNWDQIGTTVTVED